VDPDIVRWWVVLADRLKDPNGRGIIALYLSLLEPSDAAALAARVVRAWIAQDTYVGSAMADKGLLAFAVGMDDGELAGLVRAYMRDNPGRRAQFDALVRALCANGRDRALQVLLGVARRHKMAGVQATAAALAREIASERGWSDEELADRTVPTAGFDGDGLLRLSYGDREFTGRLTSDFKIEVSDGAGRTRKSLPPARSGEDAEVVRAAKKRLSAARKEAKEVLTLQSERLYEAMCASRTWSSREWGELLADHPLVGRLVTRLIWTAAPPEGGPLTFRPTEDGELIGVDDAVVEFEPHAVVSLAHRVQLADEEAAAWRQHLADYGVEPLFDQLSATAPRVAEGQMEMRDLQGHMTDTFALRGAAVKRGYKRGEVMDAGTFYDYVKGFAALGLSAVLGFTGSWVPEDKIPCATKGLSFTRGDDDYEYEIPLTEVPPVLLAECRADYEALAALGPYDPDWKKKAFM